MLTRFRRREFFKTSGAVAGGIIAGTPALLATPRPNSTIGLAVIGLGARGKQLLETAISFPDASVRAVSDLDAANLAYAQDRIGSPELHVSGEWLTAINHRDVDAVLIATPDFWHAPMILAAARAKKHVFVEPHLCLNVDEASSIRRAVNESEITFALGHPLRLDPAYLRARRQVESGRLGSVRSVSIRVGRSRVWPEWTSFGGRRRAGAEEPPAHWSRFHRRGAIQYDRNRFEHWRCYWDYGCGIAGSLMSHQWDAMNMVLSTGVPDSVSTQVDLSFWRSGSVAPDSWRCLFSYPGRSLSIDFACEFRSGHAGETTTIRTDGGELILAGTRGSGTEVLNEFFRCLLGRTAAPSCGIESAWQVAAAVDMSVESYRRGRPVSSMLV
jgi:predicted dehydrogenase